MRPRHHHDHGWEERHAAVPRSAMPGAGAAPMLATPGVMPATPDAFAYEVKWDGYRALAHWDGSGFQLRSRNGIDLARSFHELAAMRKALPRAVLLDGEIVAMDHAGRPSFSALQTRMPRSPGVRRGCTWDPAHFSIQYMVFDILHCAGRSTCPLVYTDRREVLASLALAGPCWQMPPAHPDGAELLEFMRRAGQEGIIAKRLTSIYTPGRRSSDWIKVKLQRSEEFVVVGYWSSGRNGLSSLLLGCHATAADARAGRRLRYCGKVGTGFTGTERGQLELTLAKLRSARPAVAGDLPRDAGITWCRPALVAQIRFTEWTHDGALRHPIFVALRSDKQPADVVHARDQDEEGMKP